MRTSYKMPSPGSGQVHHIRNRVVRIAPNKRLYHLKPLDYVYTNAVMRYTSIEMSRHILSHT